MTISSDGLLKLKPERFITRQPLVCHEVSVGQGDIRLSDTDQISAVNPLDLCWSDIDLDAGTLQDAPGSSGSGGSLARKRCCTSLLYGIDKGHIPRWKWPVTWVGVGRFELPASSSRSQVAVPIASAAACLSWEPLSVGVRWRPLQATGVVTHLVTRFRGAFCLATTSS